MADGPRCVVYGALAGRLTAERRGSEDLIGISFSSENSGFQDNALARERFCDRQHRGPGILDKA